MKQLDRTDRACRTNPAEAERKAAVEALAALAGCIKGLAARSSDEVWASLDLSMAQLKAFMIVVHTGGTPTRALAEKMKVGPSAVTPVVDALVAKKLVRREDDAGDRRVIWVMPTARARALHERLLEGSRAMLARIVAGVPDAELAHVRNALAALTASATNVLNEREGRSA